MDEELGKVAVGKFLEDVSRRQCVGQFLGCDAFRWRIVCFENGIAWRPPHPGPPTPEDSESSRSLVTVSGDITMGLFDNVEKFKAGCAVVSGNIGSSFSCFIPVLHSRASFSSSILGLHSRASFSCLVLLPRSLASFSCLVLVLRGGVVCSVPPFLPRHNKNSPTTDGHKIEPSTHAA